MEQVKSTKTLGLRNTKSDIQLAAADAVKAIANAAGEATKLIANSAGDAVKVLANATNEASRVVANNAAEALKVSSLSNSNDHDLLIRLETKMTGLKEDIKDIKDGTATKINDHEIRLGCLETSKTKQTTMLSIGIAMLSILVSLLLYHVFKVG